MEVHWKLELMIHLHLSALYDVTCLGPAMSAVYGLQSASCPRCTYWLILVDSWFERCTANRGDNPGEGWLDVTMTMLLNPTPSHLHCPYNTLCYVPNQNVRLGMQSHGETFAPTGTRKVHFSLMVGKLGQAREGLNGMPE